MTTGGAWTGEKTLLGFIGQGHETDAHTLIRICTECVGMSYSSGS